MPKAVGIGWLGAALRQLGEMYADFICPYVYYLTLLYLTFFY